MERPAVLLIVLSIKNCSRVIIHKVSAKIECNGHFGGVVPFTYKPLSSNMQNIPPTGIALNKSNYY